MSEDSCDKVVTCVKGSKEEGKEESDAEQQLLNNHLLLRHGLLRRWVRLFHGCPHLGDSVVDIGVCVLDSVLRLKGHGRRGQSRVGDRANNSCRSLYILGETGLIMAETVCGMFAAHK